MLKKTITYEDFNGEQVTNDFYFNLTRAEMIEYDASCPGGAIEYLTYLMNNRKNAPLIAAFKDLILRSYGERLPNGRFVKTQEAYDEFKASDAYSVLFMEIVSGEEAAAAFVNGVIPKDAQKKDLHAVAPLG